MIKNKGLQQAKKNKLDIEPVKRVPPPIKLMSLRDVIYNYVYLTPLEKNLIDQPAFQRLRFILQNSSAYLTYPSNHHNRFTHSLGVMHLGGTMFIKALENSHKDDFVAFLEQSRSMIGTLVKKIAKNKKLSTSLDSLRDQWSTKYGNIGGFKIQPHHIEENESFEIYKDYLFTINILWQSVRLSCMMHDIGHFCFSHVFEYALIDTESIHINKSLTEKKKQFKQNLSRDFGIRNIDANIPPHELMGTAIIEHLSGVSDVNIFDTLALQLGKIIFFNATQEKNDVKVISCLHSIVSGELDADRLDYIVRDPFVSGLELGKIDIHRILESLTLIFDTKNDESFKIIPSAKYISSIEQFYYQRYLMYRYLIYHHGVIRMDLLISKITQTFIDIAESEDIAVKEIRGVLMQSGFVEIPLPDEKRRRGIKNILYPFLDIKEIDRYDDCWYRSLMQDVLRCINGIKVRIKEELQAEQLSPSLDLLSLELETFLFRKSENIFSFWKRDASYFETVNELLEKYPDQGIDKELIIRALTVSENASDGILKTQHADLIYRHLVEPMTQAIRQEFPTECEILVKITEHKTLKYNKKSRKLEALGICMEQGKIQPLNEVSLELNSLFTTSGKIPNIHLFLLMKGIKTKENKDKLVKIKDIMLKSILSYVKNFKKELNKHAN